MNRHAYSKLPPAVLNRMEALRHVIGMERLTDLLVMSDRTIDEILTGGTVLKRTADHVCEVLGPQVERVEEMTG